MSDNYNVEEVKERMSTRSQDKEKTEKGNKIRTAWFYTTSALMLALSLAYWVHDSKQTPQNTIPANETKKDTPPYIHPALERIWEALESIVNS